MCFLSLRRSILLRVLTLMLILRTSTTVQVEDTEYQYEVYVDVAVVNRCKLFTFVCTRMKLVQTMINS